MTGRPRSPALAVGALVAVTVALIAIVASGDPYTVRAQFTDASQLVTGDLVEVGGRRVGLVKTIDLTDDGLAEVTLELEHDSVKPLYRGTRAAVRTIGLSGVANRFVDLVPGTPATGAIRDGGVLPTTQTRGVVDLDAVLNMADPAVRRDVQGIIREAAVALNPRTARQTNAGIEMLNPALSELSGLGRELSLDEAALSTLLERTSSLMGALARRRDAVATSVDAGAGVMTALAGERAALADALERAPDALRDATGTLRRVRTRTLPALDPLAVAARPAVRPFGELLRLVEPTLADAEPLIEELQALLPRARTALERLPGLSRAAAPALTSATRALADSLPMVSGLRPYTPELVSGFFSGFGGSTAGFYDANGHYARVHLEVGPGSANGLVERPSGDRLGGYRTGLEARCPGAAEEPAPDGSNPWADGANAGGRDGCDPGDDPR